MSLKTSFCFRIDTYSYESVYSNMFLEKQKHIIIHTHTYIKIVYIKPVYIFVIVFIYYRYYYQFSSIQYFKSYKAQAQNYKL